MLLCNKKCNMMRQTITVIICLVATISAGRIPTAAYTNEDDWIRFDLGELLTRHQPAFASSSIFLMVVIL